MYIFIFDICIYLIKFFTGIWHKILRERCYNAALLSVFEIKIGIQYSIFYPICGSTLEQKRANLGCFNEIECEVHIGIN